MMRVGLCGAGTVGKGIISSFIQDAEIIAQRLGKPLELALIGARRDPLGYDLSAYRVTRNIMDVATDPDVDVLIELIGGTTDAFDLVKLALTNGKHVVTANKALIAEHGEQLLAIAKENQRILRFEAAVAGGIPIMETLCASLAANRVTQIIGIINGTSNFILSAMHKDKLPFEQALSIAQKLGYAEADPAFDIEGIDAAHKLAILASTAFGVPLDYFNVVVEGITKVAQLDMQCAAKLGYVIKHLGIAKIHKTDTLKQYEMRVHPVLIPSQSILAQVDNATNALLIDSLPLERSIYIGQGAGKGPTTSAVMADVIAIARLQNSAYDYFPLAFDSHTRNDFPCQNADDIVTANYLRMHVDDKPGVLAAITSILAKEHSNIEAFWQEESPNMLKNKAVTVVVMTKPIAEYQMQRVLTSLAELEELHGTPNRIRVEHLESPISN